MPVIQHQNTAPGPPDISADATPVIFPTPSVPANATLKALKGETLAVLLFFPNASIIFFGLSIFRIPLLGVKIIAEINKTAGVM